ncbi:MAG: DUF348 domain-containing protein [Anaerolineaceae bacterium]|nr:DUF348 domain-containing protein [Anaerolineaceae bacterium]
MDSTLSSAPRRRLTPGWWLVVILGAALLLGCVLVCAVALLVNFIQPPPPLPVTVIDAGTAYQVDTYAATVGDVLRELNLTLAEGDVLSQSEDAPLEPDQVITIQRARTVTIADDGNDQTFRTLFTNPLDILKSAGVELVPSDRVWVDGTETTIANMLIWPVPATTITVRRALPVHIHDADEIVTIDTTLDTVGEALFEAGVTLYLADTVTPDTSTLITRDMDIVITRSQPVSIVADGVTLSTRTQGETVAAALAAAQVGLAGLDYTIPAETDPLLPGMTIRVIRVTEQIVSGQENIPYETIYQADPNTELDQITLLQTGRDGILQTNTRVRMENGVVVSETAESAVVVLEPVNEVISYGTMVVIRTINTPDGPREYWRTLRLYATSYHPAALGGSNITATGRTLTKGIVGIDPRLIPYGTEVYVEGYGIGLAADTGATRHSTRWIDLGYDDENWVSWSREVTAYILTPVPANIDYFPPG